MYEFDTVDELKKEFYLDQYDEIDAVSRYNYPDEPLWENMRPAERFLISADAPELGDALDRYAEAIREVSMESDWPQQYQEELQRILPSEGKNGVDAGYSDHFSVDLVIGGTRTYLMFEDYVELIRDELGAAESPTELQALVERNHDDWYSHFGDAFDDWYDRLWDAVHVGDPQIIDIIAGEADYSVFSAAARAQDVLEEEITAFFDISSDRVTAPADRDRLPDRVNRYAS